ncbi:hypothetical protein RJ640_024010 [Escallonia rubra]|uniref:65-kDa microtubule-associated protein 3 n=1 Tax=Escallonia rubra TaxID=112253 RepID=A0AA88S1E0_9ASTE|nr:hypothetical protein RJ640_024010 [Escallonia rubra]
MYHQDNNELLHVETTCGSLLSELQKIWDEVGEPDIERDKMIVELEQECLEAYRRKVEQASRCRAQLRQAVADSEAELAYICAALGERPVHIRQLEQATGSLKKEVTAINQQLEVMRARKYERRSKFVEVLDQIRNISNEICQSSEDSIRMMVIDESDLSLKRLDELQSHLLALEKEKSDRLKQVLDHLNTLNSLCVVLGMDFKHAIREIQPTLDDSSSTKNISSNTIGKLSAAISSLREVKIQRMERLLQLQDLATSMVELWSLMDTPVEEQKMFQSVTRNIAASENEITERNNLSLDFINFAEAEVLRLQQIKSSKMKEVILKKKLDLEELCRKARMVAESSSALDCSAEAIESGAIDPSYLLEQIELQISKVKEEAFSRKDILEKVEKWLAACEEECWLEEYNRDDNRYNAGRGTHLILKRAEKARALVNKLPAAMVEALISKARAWEKERGFEFLYDGASLLSMVEQYSILKQEKELERQRQRDQKRLQGQLIAEQEALFGSKPSPLKSGKKVSRTPTGGPINHRFSLGGVMLQTPKTDKTTLASHAFKKSSSVKQPNIRSHHQTGGIGAQSSGKTSFHVSGPPVVQNSSSASNAHEITTPMRKPLSPVSSALSSKANAGNIQDQNTTPDAAVESTLCSNTTPVASPAKATAAAHDENRTPRTMPMPTTPSSVSVAMQTAKTPITPCVPHGGQETDYSFEEMRAGFVLPNAHSKSLFQV